MKHISYIEDWEKWSKGFSVYTDVKVRFSETDAFGHINNTNAVVYFEDARLHYFDQIGLRKDWTPAASSLMGVVADVQCNYIKQIKYGDVLAVYTKLAKVGNSSIDLHYLAVNGKKEACLTGRSAIVQIDRETGYSVPWTKKVRDRLNKECLESTRDK